MIELCCEYLSVRCIRLYVIMMSRTSFTLNPHSIVVRESTLYSYKLVRDMIIKYSQMHRTKKYTQDNSKFWTVWLNEMVECSFAN